MKRILTIVVVAIVTVLGLSSCASMATGNLTNYNQNSTKVELSQNNFKVVGNAYGSYSATYIFGIGGLSKKTARTNAVANMYENAGLERAQAVINITTSERLTTYFGIINKVEYTASGTVIEFTK